MNKFKTNPNNIQMFLIAKAVGHRHQLRQSLRDVDEMTPPEDDSTDSASYIQTPKPGQKPGSKNFPIIGQGKLMLLLFFISFVM